MGFTASAVNVMPIDVFNGRTRLSVRNGTSAWNTGASQFIGTFRAFVGGVFLERLIIVRAGKIYWADPHLSPSVLNLYGTQSTAPLVTTGLVEGVQFNEYFYFVDGTSYIRVLLTGTAEPLAWGSVSSPITGPYETDPASVASGDRAKLICRFGARLVLSGYKKNPAIWFTCELDEPLIWTGGDTLCADSSAAQAGTSGVNYGTLGDPIVAIFPFAESGLMFGCTNSLVFLTKDPVFEEAAAMISLTRSIGIAGQRAWCHGQEKTAYILAKDGLYLINPSDFNVTRANRIGAGRLDSFFARLDFGAPAIGGSSPLSGGTLRLLSTIDGTGAGSTTEILDGAGGIATEPTTESVKVPTVSADFIGGLESGKVFPSLVWDPDREGVWVFLSVSGVEQSSLHFYYDTKTDSFWVQRFHDPNMYAPFSVIYVYPSRVSSGKLFMGGTAAISIIDRAFPIGIDGYSFGMTEAEQTAQLVRSSVTMGPIIAQLPYRVMLNEVRIDLADDAYELPTGFVDLSKGPILTVSTGDTAQVAIGLQNDSSFVVNLNALVIDGGTAAVPTSPTTYNGGTAAVPSPNIIDGRYAVRPFGQYQQSNPFTVGTDRIYDGPSNWVIRWNSSSVFWVISLDTGDSIYEDEYQQVDSDPATPNSIMKVLVTRQNPISPDVRDDAAVSGASFPTNTVTELATLNTGRNEAIRCRVRAEAMYLTIQSDGKPWSIERMSAVISQVGKSRGGA